MLCKHAASYFDHLTMWSESHVITIPSSPFWAVCVWERKKEAISAYSPRIHGNFNCRGQRSLRISASVSTLSTASSRMTRGNLLNFVVALLLSFRVHVVVGLFTRALASLPAMLYSCHGHVLPLFSHYASTVTDTMSSAVLPNLKHFIRLCSHGASLDQTTHVQSSSSGLQTVN